MNALEAARRIAECFAEDGIDYAIGGALALGIWGASRATDDVDISAFVPVSELPRVLDSLERAGALIDRSAASRGIERIGLCKGRLGRIEIDLFVSEHPQYAEMQRRVQRVSGLQFLSAEDLVLYKLLFGRSKDITDLERLFALRTELDLAYVRSWLVQMLPAGDRRLAVLDDLERRFITRT